MRLKKILASSLATLMAVSAMAISTSVGADSTAVTIDTLQYNFTVTEVNKPTVVTFTNQNTDWAEFKKDIEISDVGDYSVTIENMNATALTNVGFISVPEDDKEAQVALTVTSIVVNGEYTVETNIELVETSPDNGLANIWNPKGKSEFVYYSGNCAFVGDGGSSIKFVATDYGFYNTIYNKDGVVDLTTVKDIDASKIAGIDFIFTVTDDVLDKIDEEEWVGGAIGYQASSASDGWVVGDEFSFQDGAKPITAVVLDLWRHICYIQS